ncbi:MAG: hypothetical protein ACRCSK_08070 [Fusobacteriaceae bacterium]
MNVQSCITTISFPNTMEQLDQLLKKNKKLYMTDVEKILEYESSEIFHWTVPIWMQKKDIVFFYHSKSADGKIKRLLKNLDPNAKDYKKYKNILEKSLDLYKKYGGKIFAVGKVVEEPTYFDQNNEDHFKGRIFGGIKNIFIFKTPIDLKDFPDSISIKQNTCTDVFGEDYENLKTIIIQKNKMPDWFEKTTGTKFELENLNEKTFLKILSERLGRFVSEKDFRSHYVDYLLKNLSDGEIYFECGCYKKDFKLKTGSVDNIIVLNGKNIFVEVKLNIKAEEDLIGQLKKYFNTDYFKHSNNKGEKINENIFTKKILVIDTIGIYLFDEKTHTKELIEKIEDLKNIDSICALKNKLIKKIFQ